MQTVTVPVSTPYEVRIGAGLLDGAGEAIRRAAGGGAAAIVTDDIVGPLYARRLQNSLEKAGYRAPVFQFPHGERSKTLETYGSILGFLAENGLTRGDIVVALGGGVTGDLAGFAAATYLRGIGLVQMPTTLLAATDSSVGGKTGVDLPQGKNLAGAFHQPRLVLCDIALLDTLPSDIFADGCAEVIKYGLIADESFFHSLKNPVGRQLETVITRCVQLKSEVVCADEREQGARQLLNYGHTVGHAIERCSGFAVSHGRAVAIGMAVIARAAWRSGWCDRGCAEQTEQMLLAYGLPISCDFSADELCKAAMADKKRTGESITIVVPQKLGKCVLKSVSMPQLRGIIAAGEGVL